MNTDRTYRAFISYSHRDTAVAAWVQGALERYHVPAKLVGRETAVGTVPARLHPLFRDRDELPASSDLGSELMAALRHSMFLIVICSPAAATSRWVGEEVLNFKRMHGEGRVLALICDGEPGDPERECFPAALQYRIGAEGALSATRAEPIAADIRPKADGRKLAKLKLIAALTGLKLDDLARREAARRGQRLLVVAVASAIGMVLALALAFYANTQRIEANRQRKTAETESAASRAAADFLVGTFKLADPARENPRTITALTILSRSADRARAELATQPEIQVRLIDTVAAAYINLGLYGEARAALDKSRLTIDALGAQGTEAVLTLANVAFYQGDLDGAIALAEAADAKLGREGTGDPQVDRRLHARSREIVAKALYGKNDLKASLEAYNQSLSLYRRLATAKQEDVPRVLNNRGLTLADMGRYDEARKSLVEANQIYKSIYGSNSLKVGQTVYTLARNEYAAGNVKASLTLLNSAISIYNQILDPMNPLISAALTLKGQMLIDLKRPDEAVDALERAIVIDNKTFGKPHFLTGIAEVYLALAVSDTGKTDKSLAILEEAKHNYDVGYGKLHTNHGDLLVNRATILAKAGRVDEAHHDCAAGLAILETTLGNSDPAFAGYAKTCKTIVAPRTN